ncbi:MAG: hypothetical protein ACXAEX_04670 [Promethearchaeota archaeon]
MHNLKISDRCIREMRKRGDLGFTEVDYPMPLMLRALVIFALMKRFYRNINRAPITDYMFQINLI